MQLNMDLFGCKNAHDSWQPALVSHWTQVKNDDDELSHFVLFLA